MKTNIESAMHPKTGETYSIGDKVLIYQGRFGHNNVIQIKTMFESNGEVYVSGEENAQTGTYLSEVKRKIDDHEIKKILRIRNQFLYYQDWSIKL